GDDLEDEIHEGTPISGEGKGKSKGQGHGIARETPDPRRGPRGTGARRPWPGIGGRTVADGPPDGAREPGWGRPYAPMSPLTALCAVLWPEGDLPRDPREADRSARIAPWPRTTCAREPGMAPTRT